MRETDAQRPDPPQGERRHTSSSQGADAGGRGSELLAKQPSRQLPGGKHPPTRRGYSGQEGSKGSKTLSRSQTEAHMPKTRAGLEPHWVSWVSHAGFRREKSLLVHVVTSGMKGESIYCNTLVEPSQVFPSHPGTHAHRPAVGLSGSRKDQLLISARLSASTNCKNVPK